MSDTTTHLLLPYVLAAQAQKHVTHNEALRLLDGLVQLSVLDRDLTAPPGSPADGDRYIVGSGATGDWAGWDLNVALWTDGAWLRLPPRTGWRAWVEDEGLLLVYGGASWIGTTPTALQNMAMLGVGTTADGSNPFSAKLNAALWTAKTIAEGGTGDLLYTMNKEAAGDDLGLTLQTGFVTKALVGLFGSIAGMLVGSLARPELAEPARSAPTSASSSEGLPVQALSPSVNRLNLAPPISTSTVLSGAKG